MVFNVVFLSRPSQSSRRMRMGRPTNFEEHGVGDGDGQICKEREEPVVADRFEREVVSDFVDRKEKVLVRGSMVASHWSARVRGMERKDATDPPTT